MSNISKRKTRIAKVFITIYILLSILILAESLTPGHISVKKSDFVANIVQSIIGGESAAKPPINTGNVETESGTEGETESGTEGGTANVGAANVGTHQLGFILRKALGHVGIFFTLGAVGYLSFKNITRNRYINIAIMLVVGAAVAVFSEVFQLSIFTSGRIANPSDVIIDLIGYTVGIIMCVIINMLYKIYTKLVIAHSYK